MAVNTLAARIGESLVPAPSGLPEDGPRTLHHGVHVTAWCGSTARVRDERAGLARGASHPLAPRLVAHTETGLAFERCLPAAPAEREDALVAAMPTRSFSASGSVRAHLESFGGPVNLPRALARSLGRARADRLLARVVPITTGRGPSLGGVHPGWLHTSSTGRLVCLSMRHAQAEAWAALDLAAAEVHGSAGLRDVHAAAHGDGADAAYTLATLAVLLRESVLGAHIGRAATEARILETLAPWLSPGAPSTVAVRIEGPAWLDAARWAGSDVPAAEARHLIRTLDGLAVGGTTLRVHTEPNLRAGRASPSWRPRDERRRELFSRWDAGIAFDDEGLFSATPEALAAQIASGARGVAIDATCGIGALSIALARRSEVTRVVAIDTSAERLEMARHNAALYGVADRIEFRWGDARALVPALRGDLLVLDPPWGGRDYDRGRVGLGDLPLDIRPLLEAFEGAVVLKLPRSFDVAELGPRFSIEAGLDPRGFIKMLFARRPATR